MSSRKEKLLSMLQESPQDTFCLYGLAMEEKVHGSPEAALKYFEELLKVDPDYVAGYLQKAQLLIEMDEKSAAEQTIETGAEVARKVGDQHSLGEILGLKYLL